MKFDKEKYRKLGVGEVVNSGDFWYGPHSEKLFAALGDAGHVVSDSESYDFYRPLDSQEPVPVLEDNLEFEDDRDAVLEDGPELPVTNLAQEAITLVLGERNQTYGNPGDDYARTAKAWSGIIGHKLTADITPTEAIRMMVALKLCRESHAHSDDNIRDAHGYLICHEWARTGRRPE